MFSCDFCKVLMNNFFIEHLQRLLLWFLWRYLALLRFEFQYESISSILKQFIRSKNFQITKIGFLFSNYQRRFFIRRSVQISQKYFF